MVVLRIMRSIKRHSFSKVYDLQNSSRTSFYKKILFPRATSDIWSSTETTLPPGKIKQDFDKDSVLKRFESQLRTLGINTHFTLKPDFSWAIVNVDKIVNQYFNKKFINHFTSVSHA